MGFLEKETPTSVSSTWSKLSKDLKDIWPHLRRPVRTPGALFSAPVRTVLDGFKGNTTNGKDF